MQNIVSDKINKDLYKENSITGSWNSSRYRFNVFKNVNYTKLDNLISVSLFILPEVDEVYSIQKNTPLDKLKIEHENKTSCYISGLYKVVTKCPEFNIRIYCDSTSIKYAEQFLEYRNVEIYYFLFDQFYHVELKCHYGFFGTLLRYMPLFDFEKERWKSVSVIDLENNFYNAKKMINFFIKSPKSPNLVFWSRPCYYLNPRIFSMNNQLKDFALISSFLSQKTPQNQNIFIHFICKCILGYDKEYTDTLYKYLPINFRTRFFYGRLEYGVDEYFINNYFLNECYIKQNKDFYVIMYKDVSAGFLEWVKNMRFTYPAKAISNPDVTKDFLGLIVKYFFPSDVFLPDLPINELIQWVAEKYYDLNLQFSHRKIDQSSETQNFYKELQEEKYQSLDLYNEYLIGVRFNTLIKNNYFSVFQITPNGKYPQYNQEIIANIPRNN